jgi:hypothetical protein
VGLGSVAFLAWCSLFSCCSGYSAASAASAEFRLISRPDSSLRWQVEMCRPRLTSVSGQDRLIPIGSRFRRLWVVRHRGRASVAWDLPIPEHLAALWIDAVFPGGVCSLKRSGTALEGAEEIGQCSVSMAPRLSEHCRPCILQ